MSRYKELLKNTGLLAISNFSSKILIFLLVPIYTHALSTSEYGFFDLTYTTIQLCFPVLTACICEAVMRYLMEQRYNNNDVFTIGNKFSLVSIAIFSLGLLLNRIFSISVIVNDYSIYIGLYFATFVVNNFFTQFAKGLNNVKAMAVSGLLGTVLMVSCNIILLLFIKLGLEGFYIANILGQLIPAIYLFFSLKIWCYFKIGTNTELQREMLLYSLPLILNSLGWWVNNTSDRYVVTLICGMDKNGLLSVAYKIPSIITVIGGIFIQAWQISVIKEKNSKDAASYFSSLYFHFNSALCVLSGGLIVGVKIIARIFFANEFYIAWKYVPFLVISSLLNSCAGYVGAILTANMDSKSMAKSALYGIIVNLGLNILLTLFIGAQGITIATMIASFVIYYMRVKLSKSQIKDDKYPVIIISWLLLIVCSIIMIYTEWLLLAVLIYAIIIFLYFNSVKTLLSRIGKILKR